MTIITCKQCNKTLKAKDEQQGKRLQCPNCKTPIEVPKSNNLAKRLTPAVAVVVIFVLGFFAGRYHLRYQLQSKFENFHETMSKTSVADIIEQSAEQRLAELKKDNEQRLKEIEAFEKATPAREQE